MIRFLAIGSLLKMLESTASAVLLATGQSRAPAASNAVKTVALFALLPVGFHLHGLPGLLGALVASDLTRYAATLWALRRRGCVFCATTSGSSCGPAAFALPHPWSAS
jgi:hypothetical protein